jgi:hypothetical protein
MWRWTGKPGLQPPHVAPGLEAADMQGAGAVECCGTGRPLMVRGRWPVADGRYLMVHRRLDNRFQAKTSPWIGAGHTLTMMLRSGGALCYGLAGACCLGERVPRC